MCRQNGSIEHTLMLQGSLFGLEEPSVDVTFGGLERVELDATTWLDVVPGWLRGHEVVFDRLWRELPWRQRTVTMYQRHLPEPRLTWWWTVGNGPEPLAVLADARHALDRRYGEAFDSIGFNCYRHGEDSVAWHGDRHRHTVTDPVVAIVSVGAPRPLRLRPRGGGRARSFDLGHGDLFVMGGACQHDWEHSVPKVRSAGPRISITYRYGTEGIRGTADGTPRGRHSDGQSAGSM
jgi:alkylated DNA repair dioxygenase AlkB